MYFFIKLDAFFPGLENAGHFVEDEMYFDTLRVSGGITCHVIFI